MNSLIKREPLNNNGNVPPVDDTTGKTTKVNGKGLWVSYFVAYYCNTKSMHHNYILSHHTNVYSHIILLHYNMQSIYITEELETQFQEQVSSAIRSN